MGRGLAHRSMLDARAHTKTLPPPPSSFWWGTAGGTLHETCRVCVVVMAAGPHPVSVPIPVVKPASADGTAPEGVGEQDTATQPETRKGPEPLRGPGPFPIPTPLAGRFARLAEALRAWGCWSGVEARGWTRSSSLAPGRRVVPGGRAGPGYAPLKKARAPPHAPTSPGPPPEGDHPPEAIP
jgi:hypothetical protein